MSFFADSDDQQTDAPFDEEREGKSSGMGGGLAGGGRGGKKAPPPKKGSKAELTKDIREAAKEGAQAAASAGQAIGSGGANVKADVEAVEHAVKAGVKLGKHAPVIGNSSRKAEKIIEKAEKHKKEGLLFIIILCFLLIFLFVFALIAILLGGIGANENKNISLTLSKTGPAAVANPNGNGPEIKYTINASTTGNVIEIDIDDTIPDGTEYVSATGNPTLDEQNNNVSAVHWKISGGSGTVELVVRPTKPDNWVINIAHGSAVGGANDGGNGGNGTIPAGGNYNLRSWAAALLQGLGISQSDGAIKAIMHWEQMEGGHWHNGAKYNPLNTTQAMPGHTSGSFGVGIKAYDSWQTGLEATVKTLKNGSYSGILSALKNGDYSAIGQAVIHSPWGTTIW